MATRRWDTKVLSGVWSKCARIGLTMMISGASLILALMMSASYGNADEVAAYGSPVEKSPVRHLWPPSSISIDPMESIGSWYTGYDHEKAVTPTLTTVAGYNNQALQLDYDLGSATGAWAQMRRDFTQLDLSACTHVRFRYRSSVTQTVEMGLVAPNGHNYFARPSLPAMYAITWPYAIWDLREFYSDTEKFSDLQDVRGIFISVANKDANDLGGIGALAIDDLECVNLDNWESGKGSNAISVALPSVTPNDNGYAVQLTYHLSETANITDNNWAQLKYEFIPPIDLSNCDHVRVFYSGTAPHSMQVGLIATTTVVTQVYFTPLWSNATRAPTWTYGTWDFQDFRNGATFLTDFSQIRALFVSVVKDKETDAGGLGAIALREVQCLALAGREVPSSFESIAAHPTAVLSAAVWISNTQQPTTGLLLTWPEEYTQHPPNDFAYLYTQGLGLFVLTDNDPLQADKLAATLHTQQNPDGSWYSNYHWLTPTQNVTSEKAVGAIAWTVYALKYYAWKTGVITAAQDAWEGAEWLAGAQRPDGCLPGYAGDAGAPIEPNLSAWWAFKAAGHITGALRLQNCLLNEVWDASMGRFKSGPGENYQIYLDAQTWGAPFLRSIGQDDKARQALSYGLATLHTCSEDGQICGFDGAGPYSVWNEGTLQYIVAGGENSQYYWNEMTKQQAADGGLPAAPDNISAYIVWNTTWKGLAPAAWLYFAETGGPFYYVAALSDTFNVGQNYSMTVAAPGLLVNDQQHITPTALATKLFTPTAHGTIALNLDGSFVYTPTPHYAGIDTFTYYVEDGLGASNLAAVTLNIRAPITVPFNNVVATTWYTSTDVCARLWFSEIGDVHNVTITQACHYPSVDGEGLPRQYQIAADGDSFTATLSLCYEDFDLVAAGIPITQEDNLHLYRYANAATWAEHSEVDPALNQITATQVHAFGVWGIGVSSNQPTVLTVYNLQAADPSLWSVLLLFIGVSSILIAWRIARQRQLGR